MFPLENCVICGTMLWEGESVRRLIELLGGVYSEYLSASCTHVVTTRTNTHRYLLAKERYPDIPVVHPRWLWACYWTLKKPAVEPYMTDFHAGTKRTGTSVSLGTRSQFFLELGQYHKVEDHLSMNGSLLASLMQDEDYDSNNPEWGFVSRHLQDTAFWGAKVRNANWRRRRLLAMCLLQRCSDTHNFRKRMRRCHDGAAASLRVAAALPRELRRAVLTFV